jgi:oxygen-dependent protoporphyrinogen oxidase
VDEVISSARHIVVVGGGVSGLTTAFYLRQDTGAVAPDVTVIEAAPTLGGKVITTNLDGLPVDTGPDAFLSRAPELSALIDELGLRDSVGGPMTSGAYVWSKNRLRMLPPGATFGIPEKLWPLLKSGLLSPVGVVRAAGDFVLPKSKVSDDPSVADLTRPRFGNEVFDRMVQPLLGGVHAGDANLLSATSTVPEIAGMAKNSRSLYLGLRKRKKSMATSATAGKPPAPPLVTVHGGLGGLITALVENLNGAKVKTSTRVESIVRTPQGYSLALSDGTSITADEVVLATPAYVASALLKDLVPAASAVLDQTPYVDVCSVTMSFDRTEVGEFPKGTGFLVPPCEKEFLVGVSWLSSKWAHVNDENHQIVRVLVGRSGDSRWATMSDKQLVSTVRTDLARIQGVTAEPRAVVVQRWPQGMPQYTVGHAKRLEALETALLDVPGLHLTGAAYRGVGLAGCVAQAKKLSQQLTAVAVSADSVTEGADR